MKTALLLKGDQLGTIGYRNCCACCPRYIEFLNDPRQVMTEAVYRESAEKAESYFRRDVAASMKNGWQLIYIGPPNRG